MKFHYLVPGIICCLLWNFSLVMSFVEEDFLDKLLPEGHDDIIPQAKRLIKLLEQENPAKVQEVSDLRDNDSIYHTEEALLLMFDK